MTEPKNLLGRLAERRRRIREGIWLCAVLGGVALLLLAALDWVAYTRFVFSLPL